MNPSDRAYRGRLAPSPTGYLHLGHARTFWAAQSRAQARQGNLVLRNDDLDGARCKPEFVRAMLEDLRWFGLAWAEGPDCGGPYGPYQQSERMEIYRAALEKLHAGNFIYPCTCSRKDILAAARAPHAVDDEEPLYPGTCRSRRVSVPAEGGNVPAQYSWRFRVPDGETVSFVDGHCGAQAFVAGRDFGDFVIWRHDGVPAYHLACVVDDAAMLITEVVRGADLLRSTARQILLYRAFGFTPPQFYHCDLMLDETGQRLSKRHDSLSLRSLREHGESPELLRRNQFFREFEK
jgi:glutamyl-tRNA synthetase